VTLFCIAFDTQWGNCRKSSTFYRAMIRQRANRPSVRPSVTLLKYRSHIGWNTSKIVSRLIRLRSLLFFCRPNITDLPEILARIGKQLATMHHLTCGINSLLHSVHSPPGSPHPVHITSSQSSPSFSPSVTPSTFHSRLKTHLFHKSFPP